MEKKKLAELAAPLLEAAGVERQAAPFDIQTMLNKLSEQSFAGVEFKQQKAKEIQDRISALRAQPQQKEGGINLDAVATLGDLFFNKPGKFTGIRNALKKNKKDSTGELYNLENQLIGYQNSISKDQNNLFDALHDFMPKEKTSRLGDQKALADHKHGQTMEVLRQKFRNTSELLGKKQAAKGSGKTEKRANAAQYKSAGFGKLMQKANKGVEKLLEKGFDFGSTFNTGRGAKWTPELMKSEDLKLYQTYKENFLGGHLRDVSGAAIGTSEYVKAERQFFPLPGDTKELLKQKALLREQEMSKMRASSGSAWDDVDDIENIGDFEKGQGSSKNSEPKTREDYLKEIAEMEGQL